MYQREAQKHRDNIDKALNLQMPFPSVASSHGSCVSRSTFPVKHVESFRNLVFHGRQDLLKDMHDFIAAPANPPFAGPACLALHGLGGIGKTATALEYTFVYKDYYDAIFWVRAQSSIQLSEDYCAIARKLRLDLQYEKQALVIEEVKNWLEGTSEYTSQQSAQD